MFFIKKTIKLYFFLIFILLNIFLSNINISIADDDDEFFEDIPVEITNNNLDPLEKSNRAVFKFNTHLYKVFIPIGKVYEKIPIEIRWTFKNLVQNYTETPKDAVLSVFDFDLEAMIASFWRFAINSIFGFFGCFDVAYSIDLPSYHKTLHHIAHFYHIPNGPYIILPIFGPSSITSTFVSLIDFAFFNPWFWPFIFKPFGFIFSGQNYLNPFLFINYRASSLIYASLGMTAGNYIHLIGTNFANIANLFENSIDPYVAMRNNYLQEKEKSFEKYDEIRKKGQIQYNNICDYDAYIDLPEECNEDPKEYGYIETSKYNNF